jgi:hypothetical protein
MAVTRDAMEDTEVSSPKLVVEQENELPKRPESPALAPLTERDLELVDLPTEFDPDAEPAPIARRSSLDANDVEDTLQVPIRSIEDEDAEEARQLAELDKRRNPPPDEGEEEDGNLEELLRGLQGDEDGEGEIEGGDDEILAEMPQEEESEILAQEVVPEPEIVSLPEASLQQDQEDIQMDSSTSFVPMTKEATTEEGTDNASILVTFVRPTRPPNRTTNITTTTPTTSSTNYAEASHISPGRVSRRIIYDSLQAS